MKVGQNADKQGVLERLLDLGMVLVAIDARIDGVDVPSHLGVDPQLRLNLSYRFGRPMDIDAWGITAELTFGGVPYGCRFPWKAVFLIVSHINGESFLFPDHVPQELLQQATAEHDEEGAKPASAPTKARRPALTLVTDTAPSDASEDDEDDDDAQGLHDEDAQDGDASVHAPTALGVARPEAAPEPAAEPVPQPAETHDAEPPQAPEAPPAKRSRGHLRLVK